MSRDLLYSEFVDRALDPERLFLLPGPDAIKYIDRAIELGLKLVGVEAFRVTPDGAYQPDQGQSNDIADTHLGALQFVEATKALISRRLGSGYCFEVVVIDKTPDVGV